MATVFLRPVTISESNPTSSLKSIDFSQWNNHSVASDGSSAYFTNSKLWYRPNSSIAVSGTNLKINSKTGAAGSLDVSGTVTSFTVQQKEAASTVNVVNYEVLSVNLDFKTFIASSKDPLAFALAGDDQIWGTDLNDILRGYNGNDLLSGGAGADVLDGGEGFDWASYQTAQSGVIVDLNKGIGLEGDAKGDTYISIESIVGSSYNDVIYAGSGAHRYYGLGGIDVVSYTYSTAAVSVDLKNNYGGSGFAQGDTYFDIEQVYGSKFNDNLSGSDNSDSLAGGKGNDIITGYAGNDYLYGEEGNDHFIGGAGADFLNGGDGYDTVYYGGSGAGVTVDLKNNSGKGGEAEGDTFFSIERVVGSQYSDTLGGTDSIDSLYGGNGNDVLWGHSGNDYLFGEDGDDSLSGGAGADVLDGGFGRDFVSYFTATSRVVIDFVKGVGTEGDAKGDSFVSIEGVWGSLYSDLFYEGVDAHSYSNLGQMDTVSYIYSTSAVTVDLVKGTGKGGFAQGDSFWGISQINGSQFNDSLYGDISANVLLGDKGDDKIYGHDGNDFINGQQGNDYIDAGVGNDKLFGEDGNDSLYGGAGNDNIVGGSGNDFMYGGAGDDWLNGGFGNDTLYLDGGKDTLAWEKGCGNDTVYGFTKGFDKIYMGYTNITADQVVFTQKNNGLLVTVGSDSLFLDGMKQPLDIFGDFIFAA
jgi:Ca2+-binding RTX toxin-like protein